MSMHSPDLSGDPIRRDLSKEIPLSGRENVLLAMTRCVGYLESCGSVPNFQERKGVYRDDEQDIRLGFSSQQLSIGKQVLSATTLNLKEGPITRLLERPMGRSLWNNRYDNSDIIAILGSIETVKQSEAYNIHGLEIDDAHIWNILRQIPCEKGSHQRVFTREKSFFDEHLALTTEYRIGERGHKRPCKRPVNYIVAQRLDTLKITGQPPTTSVLAAAINPHTYAISMNIATSGALSSRVALNADAEECTAYILDVCKDMRKHIPETNDPLSISEPL